MKGVDFFPTPTPLRLSAQEEKGGQVVSACPKVPDKPAVFSCPMSASQCRPEWFTVASVGQGHGLHVWLLGIAEDPGPAQHLAPERSNRSKPTLATPP